MRAWHNDIDSNASIDWNTAAHTSKWICMNTDVRIKAKGVQYIPSFK